MSDWTKGELELSGARQQAAKASLLMSIASAVKAGVVSQEWAQQVIAKADAAALQVQPEDLVRVKLA